LPQNYPLASGAAVREAAAANLAISQAVLKEFLETDIVVIGAPMYNFTIPTQLKAWIDRIIITGRTFRYTVEGAVEGLAGDKRVIIALSRGGFYEPGTPSAASEHSQTYLRAIFGFIGINPQFIVAEGIQMGPKYHEKAIESALAAAAGLGAA
jgi:FMN-dependent NADH-azoreductase